MGWLIIHLVGSFFKVFTKKSIIFVIVLTLATFLLGTIGFKHYENKGIEEDNNDIIEQYMTEHPDAARDYALDYESDNLTDLYDTEDSFYWTFTTVTTVGFGDVSPATSEGRIVYYFVGIMGICVIGIIIGELGSYLMELSLMKMRGLKKSKMKNHIVIIGWNAATEVTHNELKNRGYKCIVIDETKDFMKMKTQGVDLVVGNGLDTEVLIKADIENAKALIIPIRSDEDTVMISLKARRLNKNLLIIASVKDEENIDIVHEAGVSTMIPSSKINGLLLANSIEEKLVVDFIVDICQELEGLDISQHVLEKPMKIKDIPMNSGQKIITAYRNGKPFLDFTSETKLNKWDWVLSLSYHEKKK